MLGTITFLTMNCELQLFFVISNFRTRKTKGFQTPRLARREDRVSTFNGTTPLPVLMR
jgi:hypothetical protein